MAEPEKNEVIIHETYVDSPICGPFCPHCLSENVYGQARIVGYYSIIGNWNRSKQAERHRRLDGNYWADDLE